MKHFLLFLLLIILVNSCKEKDLTAQQIIDKSIQYSGADKIAKSEITFQFRNKQYSAKRNNGLFTLSKTYVKDNKIIKDILKNDSFKRTINDSIEYIEETEINKYANSVNSVHYFSVLPYGLNDNAVNKKLLSSAKIKGKDYYKIHVTFNEDGGGNDFDDVFIYWIDKKTFLIDYLAYSYHVNGGGVRFREVTKRTDIKGVKFANYNNYKPKNKSIDLLKIDNEFLKNQLILVSKIELENISIKL